MAPVLGSSELQLDDIKNDGDTVDSGDIFHHGPSDEESTAKGHNSQVGCSSTKEGLGGSTGTSAGIDGGYDSNVAGGLASSPIPSSSIKNGVDKNTKRSEEQSLLDSGIDDEGTQGSTTPTDAPPAPVLHLPTFKAQTSTFLIASPLPLHEPTATAGTSNRSTHGDGANNDNTPAQHSISEASTATVSSDAIPLYKSKCDEKSNHTVVSKEANFTITIRFAR